MIKSSDHISLATLTTDVETIDALGPLVKDGQISRREVTEEYTKVKNSDPARAALLRSVLLRRPTDPKTSQTAVRIQAQAPGKQEQIRAHMDKYRSLLDALIIGQEKAKDAMCRIEEARVSTRVPKKGPYAIMFPGPPGVGKTEFARALATLIHGSRDKVAMVDGSTLKDQASFNKIFGAPAGFVGYEAPEQFSSVIGPRMLTQMFGDKRPRIILLDEVDKIGNGDPKIIDSFGNQWGNALETGLLTFDNGASVDISGDIVILTSNSGANDPAAKTLKGDALLEHYEKSMAKTLPTHIQSRVGDIVPFGPHSVESARGIAKKKIAEATRGAESDHTKRTGEVVKLTASDEVADLVAELGISDIYGARPIDRIVQNLISTIIGQGDFQDEEHHELVLKKMSPVERQQLVAAFRAQSGGGIPAAVSIRNFPVELKCIQRAPRFEDYNSPIPLSDLGQPIVHGSGLLMGRGFMVYNQGTTDDKNELILLQPGKNGDDVKRLTLPNQLADANLSLQTAVLSENQLFLVGTSIVEGLNEPQTNAFIYDAVKKSFTTVPTPPVALVGASICAAEGKVVMSGGRSVRCDDDGQWSVHLRDSTFDDPNTHYDNTKPIEEDTWILDTTQSEATWSALASRSSAGKVGTASVVVGKHIYFIGGETLTRHPQGTLYSVSSNQVEILDLTTQTFTPAASLPEGVAHATAFLDSTGQINIIGGVEYLDFGETQTPTDRVYSYRPGSDAKTWKAKPALPQAAVNLCVIPRLDGQVIGPFYDEDFFSGEGAPQFKLLR